MFEVSACHPVEVFLISRLLYLSGESDAATLDAVKGCVGLTNDSIIVQYT